MSRPYDSNGFLRAGVEQSAIALWLRRESRDDTDIFDLGPALKDKMPAKTIPPAEKDGRHRSNDEMLAFLKGL